MNGAILKKEEAKPDFLDLDGDGDVDFDDFFLFADDFGLSQGEAIT